MSFVLPKAGMRGWGGRKNKEKNMSSAGTEASLYFFCTLRARMGNYIAIAGLWGDAKEIFGGRKTPTFCQENLRVVESWKCRGFPLGTSGT